MSMISVFPKYRVRICRPIRLENIFTEETMRICFETGMREGNLLPFIIKEQIGAYLFALLDWGILDSIDFSRATQMLKVVYSEYEQRKTK